MIIMALQTIFLILIATFLVINAYQDLVKSFNTETKVHKRKEKRTKEQLFNTALKFLGLDHLDNTQITPEYLQQCFDNRLKSYAYGLFFPDYYSTSRVNMNTLYCSAETIRKYLGLDMKSFYPETDKKELINIKKMIY